MVFDGWDFPGAFAVRRITKEIVMRLSTDPHIQALQITARRSRRDWMRSARFHAKNFRFWGNGFSEVCMRNAITMARRASRSAWQINKS